MIALNYYFYSEEYQEALKHISDVLSNITIPDFSPAFNVLENYQKQFDEFSKKIKLLYEPLEEFSIRISQLSKPLTEMSNSILSAYEGLISVPESAVSCISFRLDDSLASVIRESQPYLSEDQKETLREISPDLLSDSTAPPIPQKKRISVSDMLSILSILISLIFGILSLMPDNQLSEISENTTVITNQTERIIHQNTAISDQNEEMISLLEKLVENVDAISDTLQAIEDDIRFSSEPQEEQKTADRQNQHADRHD